MEIKKGMRVAMSDWLTTRYLTVTYVYKNIELFEAVQNWDGIRNLFQSSHDWYDCDLRFGFTKFHPRGVELLKSLPEELID